MPITSKSAQEIASLCDGWHKTSDGYRAKCPAHGGKNPTSLRIWEYQGKTYLRCYSQDCRLNDILKAIGVEPDWTPGDSSSKTYYEYEDANGYIIYRVVKYYAGNKKLFVQERPNPSKPGRWIKGRGGIPLVLYRLPKIIEAVRDRKTILLLEGEKDVQTAERMGFIATTNPEGAGKWKIEFCETLKGADLIIIPDDDDSGQKHLAQVRRLFKAANQPPPILVELPRFERGGDFTDWVDRGGTKEQLEALIQEARLRPIEEIQDESEPLTSRDYDDSTRFQDKFDQAVYSEITAGKQLVAEYGHSLHYVHRWGEWLSYNRGIWEKDESGILDRHGKFIIASLGHEAKRWLSSLLEVEEDELIGMKPKQIDSLSEDVAAKQGEEKYRGTLIEIGMARSLYGHSIKMTSKLTDIINLAKSEDGIHIPIDSLDKHPFKLVCNNGVVDLTSGTLLPFNANYLITKRININYDPNAKAPRWEKFLLEIMGDPAGKDNPDMSEAKLDERTLAHKEALELVSYLKRAVGYTITGSVRDQVMFVLHGSGANGKSLFVSTLIELLGELSKKATSRLFMYKKHNDHPTEIADLFGKRFVAAVETEEDQRLDEVFIKEVTGNDTITARHMQENFWEFSPTHKLWLATNHRPQIRDVSYAMFRRLQLIPFNVRFQMPNTPIDKSLPIADLNLESELRSEMPGILAWAVQGAMEWYENGLNPPRTVQEATEDYRQDQDIFGQFIEDKCIIGPDYNMVYSQAWEVFKSWAEDCNRYPGTKNSFSKKLLGRGYEKRKSNNNVIYDGIGLKS